MQDVAARSQALDALIRALLALTDRARLEFAAWAADNTGLAVPTSRGGFPATNSPGPSVPSAAHSTHSGSMARRIPG